MTQRVPYCPADRTELSEEILSLLPASIDPSIAASIGGTRKKSRAMENLIAVAVLVLVVVIASVLFGGGDKSEEEPDYILQDTQSQQDDSYRDEHGKASPETEAAVEEVTEAPTEAPTEEPTEEPTQAPTEAELTPLQYWIENCDSEKMSKDDLKGFTKEECRLARNAIFAKSGRKFDDKELQRYFEGYDWYDPSVDPDDFQNSMLNKVQSHNLEVILDYEERKGYR